ncbi:hypothetical protein ACVPOY_10750 [Staphylococcus aureus]
MRKLQQQIRLMVLPHLTQLQDNLKHQVEQAQNVAGVNGVKDKGNTLKYCHGCITYKYRKLYMMKTS